jgi:MFS family permease
MVMGCNALGLIGCIIGGTAKNIDTLIGANLLNGIAAAGQLSFGIVLGELVPNKQRGPIVTLAFSSSLPFAVFGPLIARLFIERTSAGWRWSYYIGIIFSVIALVLFQFLYHPPTYDQLHVHGKTKMQQFKELDFIGIFLFIAGVILFLIGLSWGGTTYPWKSAAVLCTILIGALLLVAFVCYEGFFCKGQALMPPRLFKNIGFVGIVGVAAIAAMVYYALTVLWPTILGSIYTTDSLKIGLASSVVGGGILLGQLFGGFAISYLPKVKWQLIILSTLSTAFLGAEAGISITGYAAFITFGVLATFVIGWIDNITFPGVTLLFESQGMCSPSSLDCTCTNTLQTLVLQPAPWALSAQSAEQSHRQSTFRSLPTSSPSTSPSMSCRQPHPLVSQKPISPLSSLPSPLGTSQPYQALPPKSSPLLA